MNEFQSSDNFSDEKFRSRNVEESEEFQRSRHIAFFSEWSSND